MSVIVVIPARGGSKGLHRKNIKLLAGKHLVGYAIEAALGAKYVDRVFVSTDDDEIAKISKEYGAEVIIRPVELAGDKTASEEAVLHVIAELEKHENYTPDIALLQQCTVPHTQSHHIDGVIKAIKEKDFDSCFSCIATHQFMWGKDKDGFAVGLNHDHTKPRVMRQDLPEQVIENGAVYAFRVEPFKEKKNRFCGKVGYCIVDMNFLDIDTEEDWQEANEWMTKHKRENK